MNLFKRKKDKYPKASAPRSMNEIVAEFNKLCREAGSLQYELAVKKQHLEQLNKRLSDVNVEAEARKKLDAETASKKEDKKEG